MNVKTLLAAKGILYHTSIHKLCTKYSTNNHYGDELQWNPIWSTVLFYQAILAVQAPTLNFRGAYVYSQYRDLCLQAFIIIHSQKYTSWHVIFKRSEELSLVTSLRPSFVQFLMIKQPCIHHLSWNHFYIFMFPNFCPQTIHQPSTNPHLTVEDFHWTSKNPSPSLKRIPNIGYITRFLLLDQGACLGPGGWGKGRRFHQGFGRSLLAHLLFCKQQKQQLIRSPANLYTNAETLFL